eukprot:2871268-Rhodomonas_salina.2
MNCLAVRAVPAAAEEPIGRWIPLTVRGRPNGQNVQFLFAATPAVTHDRHKIANPVPVSCFGDKSRDFILLTTSTTSTTTNCSTTLSFARLKMGAFRNKKNTC